MHRRNFLTGAASVLAFPAIRSARGQPASDFDQALAGYVADVAALDDARAFRELEFRERSLLETQGVMTGRKSSRQISPRAFNLIVGSEISSQAAYVARYRQPVWPRGNSGITIGIGYDLGFVNEPALANHWDGLLPDEAISAFQGVCGLKGQRAAAALSRVQQVTVDWQPAAAQFNRFLPYAIGETEDHFPGCDGLSDDSLGAMVSIVYNRGSDTSDTDRRREMHRIKLLMAAGDYAAVPAQIRSMKRIWVGDPNARGLLTRRELEAKLFEAGLT